ncbi:helix-turn-helix domain-containing protein [Facilibium subflavum]|uniref:helix-turn-helix domain-containing protein n=1 Tax=Facilibium subflavum TaxID=2219058 RepID=UPI0013C352AC|nr:helix-turn-helix transcriptional regulator [Facilibium subflavum]
MGTIQNICNNIYSLMQQKGIKSVSQLAREIGCSATTIYNITSQTNKNPSIETIKMLADYFDVSIDQFVRANCVMQSSQKLRTCPLINQDQISDFYLQTLDYSSIKVTEIANQNLSDQAFAIRLSQDIQPYHRNNILIFDTLNIDTIAFPTLCVIKSAADFDITQLYQIDQQLYIKENYGLLHKKERLIPAQEHYSQFELIAALIEVKFYN